jgi:hypothetical protein
VARRAQLDGGLDPGQPRAARHGQRQSPGPFENEDGTGDATFSNCVAETFKYAPFPAHDRDGGVVFTQPLRFD